MCTTPPISQPDRLLTEKSGACVPTSRSVMLAVARLTCSCPRIAALSSSIERPNVAAAGLGAAPNRTGAGWGQLAALRPLAATEHRGAEAPWAAVASIRHAIVKTSKKKG